jgi:hypothetical protein
MKKAVFAFAASLVMMSCGGNATEEVVSDSTLVADSSVVATDTTTAQIGNTVVAKDSVAEQPVK